MINLHHASCLDWLADYDGPLFDSCVCDPPYELGFMGKAWDSSGVAFKVETWRAVYDALKPGAYLVAFSGTRTYHRMVCAIEDAGFEIRDQLAFCYGSGFPKSHNINKALGKQNACCDCENPVYEGYENQGQKAAVSVLQHNLRSVPFAYVSPTECAGDECGQVLQSRLPEHSSQERGAEGSEPEIAGCEQSGMEGRCHAQAPEGELQGRPLCQSAGLGKADGSQGRLHNGASPSDGADVRVSADKDGGGEPYRPQSKQQSAEQPRIVSDERRSQTGRSWPICAGCGKPILPDGLGTALKPAWEPICLARKPLSEKNIAANVLTHGTGAINVDGCRVGTEGGTAKGSKPTGDGNGIYGNGLHGNCKIEKLDSGRWPANIIHDGSDEVLAGFPDTENGFRSKPSKSTGAIFGNADSVVGERGHDDSGSAARFFYSSKAGPLDRIGTAHATVKPVDLMRWLCRLITPPGGHILEPFAGSGTTGIAAMAEGFDCTMIELEADHVADIQRKLDYLQGKGGLSAMEKHKARIDRQTEPDNGPLFAA